MPSHYSYLISIRPLWLAWPAPVMQVNYHPSISGNLCLTVSAVVSQHVEIMADKALLKRVYVGTVRRNV